MFSDGKNAAATDNGEEQDVTEVKEARSPPRSLETVGKVLFTRSRLSATDETGKRSLAIGRISSEREEQTVALSGIRAETVKGAEDLTDSIQKKLQSSIVNLRELCNQLCVESCVDPSIEPKDDADSSIAKGGVDEQDWPAVAKANSTNPWWLAYFPVGQAPNVNDESEDDTTDDCDLCVSRGELRPRRMEIPEEDDDWCWNSKLDVSTVQSLLLVSSALSRSAVVVFAARDSIPNPAWVFLDRTFFHFVRSC